MGTSKKKPVRKSGNRNHVMICRPLYGASNPFFLMFAMKAAMEREGNEGKGLVCAKKARLNFQDLGGAPYASATTC